MTQEKRNPFDKGLSNFTIDQITEKGFHDSVVVRIKPSHERGVEP